MFRLKPSKSGRIGDGVQGFNFFKAPGMFELLMWARDPKTSPAFTGAGEILLPSRQKSQPVRREVAGARFTGTVGCFG